MKVYIAKYIYGYGYGDGGEEILGVFDSEQKAEVFCDEHFEKAKEEKYHPMSQVWKILETELNEKFDDKDYSYHTIFNRDGKVIFDQGVIGK